MKKTHGKSRTHIYDIWIRMKQRCQNPKDKKYPMYGGRGICVCDRWNNSFENFLSDMGERPPGLTLERKDNLGNYEPENCVWATPKAQANNTRRNRLITFNGETMTLTDWAKKIGISVGPLYERLEKWPLERALTSAGKEMGPALRKILQARSNLLLVDPFFWNLAWRLKLVEDPPCGCEHSGGPTCPHTMWTDGKSIGFNPEWVKTITMDETGGVVCHEVGHVMLGHPWRRGGRDKGIWNDAGDMAINPMLLSARKVLPPPFLLPDEPGKSTEEYYDRLKKKKQQGGQDKQQQQNQRGQGVGEVRDYEGPDKAEQQAKWQQAVLQAAAIAKAQEKLPAFVESIVEEIKHPGVDWRSALRRFFEENAANDFSWRFPNRKFLAAGLYMPCLRSEQMPEVVIVGDSSGSMYDKETRMIVLGEAGAIIEEVKPSVTHWMCGDTEYKDGKDYYPGDRMDLTLKGGGATAFGWVGEKIAEQGWNPACVVVVTDLIGEFGDPWPWPTIWASTTKGKAPWGDTIEVKL